RFYARRAPASGDAPVPAVRADDQLWLLFAPQDPVRCGANVSRGRASPAGPADHAPRRLRDGGAILESPGEAIPEPEAILRVAAGTRTKPSRSSRRSLTTNTAVGGLHIGFDDARRIASDE